MFCTKCDRENVFKSVLSKANNATNAKNVADNSHPQNTTTKPKPQKLTTTLPYINELSLRTITRLMSVSATAILKWIKQYTLENYKKPKPQTNTTVAIELDEV